MKNTLLTILAALALAAPAPSLFADGTNKVDFSSDLALATAQLGEKFSSGKTTKDDLAENLQTINALIVKHQKDGDREQLAQLYLLDARIYADAWDNNQRATAILTLVKRDYAATKAAKEADARLGRLKAKLAEEAAVQEGLEKGMRFPGFAETDASGKPLSLAAYRGKVVLVDFWATWCGPCRAELPNVIAAYKKYHAKGFEVVGISLDSDNNKLTQFTQSQGMPWPQYFDGAGWENKLAKKYGVNSIPMTYLLDSRGRVIGKSLRGERLAEAVAKALENL